MAAGDISKILLSKVRTLLDEATAGNWQDTEIYAALNDGQREIINFVLAVYKQKIAINPDEKLPEILRVLFATTTGGGTQNLPSGFLYPLSLYGTSSNVPIFIRPDGATRAALKANTYLASSASQPFASFNATQVIMETGAVSWTMEYLASPSSDIDGSHDPVLGSIGYNAMVEYATAFLLTKDENPRSQQHLENFFTQTKNLIF